MSSFAPVSLVAILLCLVGPVPNGLRFASGTRAVMGWNGRRKTSQRIHGGHMYVEARSCWGRRLEAAPYWLMQKIRREPGPRMDQGM
ncbi:hypothetical protein BO94DRAFT_530169 [Aspergillus sclerotioniger CBS 115572]|uniref:Secreted protein n=1 Tax=Aspergillus sclerotioniger CBS 115572 TaxID=1450535 RepID=A0A317XAB9_9EURO|nr:hypothetical protein BO94DRAFT_530169 [Aspergillus sclerotioniger CBS 115572]PWY95449.1 hypothetical protein BO94DRAFT_530169 [Aspergillus sclerotioniger CBS 115572]